MSQISQTELSLQSHNVLASLQSLNLRSVSKVAVYLNFEHSEVQTDAIIQFLFQHNKRVFLPKVVNIDPEEKRFVRQKFKLEFYELNSYQDVLGLQPQGKFKIREPNSGFNIMEDDRGFDLIMVPGLAFTKGCYRMGHGAGLYDDFIKRHHATFKRNPYLLGVGLQQQLVDQLPVEEHDEKLDGIIIDNQFYGVPI